MASRNIPLSGFKKPMETAALKVTASTNEAATVSVCSRFFLEKNMCWGNGISSVVAFACFSALLQHNLDGRRPEQTLDHGL